MDRMRLSVEERFWSWVDLDGPVPEHDPILGPCALYRGAPNTWGYGQFWDGTRNVPAHVWIAERKIRPRLPGESVQHRCDVRLCVNYWAHLRVGPAYDNDLDKMLRGRQARGQSHGMTPLTEEDVLAIRAASTGAFGEQRALGRQYGVTSATIHNILKGKTWAHLVH